MSRAVEVTAIRMTMSHCRLAQYFPRRCLNRGTRYRPPPGLSMRYVLSGIVVYLPAGPPAGRH